MNSIVISGHNGFICSSLTSRLKKFHIIGISNKKRKKEKNVTSIVKNVNKVNKLINEIQSSGKKSIQWDATNNKGQSVSAGVYLYRIQAGNYHKTKKMVLF